MIQMLRNKMKLTHNKNLKAKMDKNKQTREETENSFHKKKKKKLKSRLNK